ncbi:MAG TPA: O-antigen ligase family protein [Pseudacidobacterium sp.]|jgi:O-antigen ligase|nr:O-antigen ligase family protein [Pseudacidobacterium sp.]
MPSSTFDIEHEYLVGRYGTGMPFAVGFFFSFRLFIVLLSVRIFGAEPQTGVEAGLALNIFFLFAAAFYSLGEIRCPLKQMLQLSSVRWAFVFLGFSGCSLFWSSTASLSAAAAFWCAMAADVAIVVLLLRANPLRVTVASIMKGYVWGACVVAVIAWLLPAQSDMRLGDEELLGPNQIGYLCAFAIFFAQYLMREWDEKWSMAILLLAVTLLRSLSKTSIIAFLAGESFMLLRDRSIKLKTKLLLVFTSAVVVAIFWSLLASYYEVYTNAGSQSQTLTGRIGIWAYILSEAIEQPWIGHGFHSVWKVIPPFGPDLFEARHAHNELLQQFYAYGSVGIIMFMGIYGSMYLQIRQSAAGPMKTFLFSFLIFVLIRGLADTEPFDLSFPLWAITMTSLLVDRAVADKIGSNDVECSKCA